MTGQRTLAAPARIEGHGLHLGEAVHLELRPAPENSGISFVRTDLPGEPRIEAAPRNLRVVPRRTALVNGDAEVQTVEHLMAALWALGIQNLEIRIDGPELPGLDGSSLPYYRALKEAGIAQQEARKRHLDVHTPIVVSNGDASLVALQGKSGLRVTYTLDYDSPVLGKQHFSIDLNEESFAREIAPARTFVLEEEALALQAAGFGKGASTQNTLVLARDGRVIDNELRFENEFVRHKILDLLGDLYLVNCDLRAHVVAIKSGHSLNIELARSLSKLVPGGSSENGAHCTERARRQTRTEDLPKPSAGPEPSVPMDIQAIEKRLPHRYPFLLVDRVVELEPGGRYAKGIKNVTANESYFRGHFPGNPVMPGVLVIEALAQLSGILLWATERDAGRLAYLLSMDGVKFRRPVVPGDQLTLEARLTTRKNRSAEVDVRASVADVVVAEAQIRFMLAPQTSGPC